jgi:hypothetical protein
MGEETRIAAMLASPLPTGFIIAYTAAGAIAYWAKWGRDRLRVFYLAEVLDMIPMRRIVRARVEFILFVVLGCFLGIGLVQPTNMTQSFSAGFAWVGLFTTMEDPDKLGRSRKKK